MRASSIAKRYAKALWSVAKNPQEATAWLVELQEFSAMMRSSKDLGKFMTSPLVDLSKKQAAMTELLDKAAPTKEVRSFFASLLEARRMDIFEDVVAQYRSQVYAATGVMELVVESALPLTDAQKKDISERFEKMTQKKAVLLSKVNARLLAGMKVSVGGKTYDGSLKTYLDSLQNNLLKEESTTHATA